MNTYRIVPAALVATMIAAGGASHAFAETDLNDQKLPPYFTQDQMQQSAANREGSFSTQSSMGALTLSMAEQEAMQKALQNVGGGKVIATETYGSGKDMHWFDIQNGDSTKRVYVNGKTGKVAVIDATIFGIDHKTNHDENRG